MNSVQAKQQNACSRAEIAAYVDGELSPHDEIALEMHLAACESCAAELNEQKKLLQALDFSLEDEKEFELPPDFAKIVTARAESSVSGLRRPTERYNALLMCSALLLLIVFGFGSGTESAFQSFGKLFEQVFTVAGFVGHLIFDIAVAIAVIVRSLCAKFVYNSSGLLVFVALIFGVSTILFSRLMFRHSNALKSFKA